MAGAAKRNVQVLMCRLLHHRTGEGTHCDVNAEKIVVTARNLEAGEPSAAILRQVFPTLHRGTAMHCGERVIQIRRAYSIDS